MISFRISAHRLNIEQARINNFAIDVGGCPLCHEKGVLEDELHVFKCSKYDALREAQKIRSNMTEVEILRKLQEAQPSTMEYLSKVLNKGENRCHQPLLGKEKTQAKRDKKER